MKHTLKISGAGNVVVPAFLALQQRGYLVRREQRADGAQTWLAQSATFELVSDDPVTLLALAAIAETRGEHWGASDAEIQSFLDDYGVGEPCVAASGDGPSPFHRRTSWPKESMRDLRDFEIVGNHAQYRPMGELLLDQATELIASGIAFARERQVRNLMVVTLGLTGFQPPNVIQRYYFIHEWARASERVMRVAVVAHPEMIDPQKFGVTVAFNIGFACDVFTSEEEALTWLRRA